MSFEVRWGTWQTVFAVSWATPKGPWAVLESDVFGMPRNVTHADPTIRWIPDKGDADTGFFYLMTGRASPETPCADSSGRYYMEIYRSRTLRLDSWEASSKMGVWTNGSTSNHHGMILANASADKKPAPGQWAPSQQAYMRNMSTTTGDNEDCNASDLDLCEFEGQTVLIWNWGHQRAYGGLVLGLSPLPLAQYLEQWF